MVASFGSPGPADASLPVAVSDTFEAFYARDTFSLKNKLAPHELFMMRLVELINQELDSYRNSVDEGVTTSNIMDVIEGLFTYHEKKEGVDDDVGRYFIESIINIAEDTFPDSFKFLERLRDSERVVLQEIFSLVSRNIGKMKYKSQDGSSSLRLRFEHGVHFITGDTLKLSDFPPGKVFLMNLGYSSQGFMKKVVSDSELQDNSKKSLVACHDLNYPDRIILVPAERLSDLSKTNIKEGFLDEDGIVHHDIFVSNDDGIKLKSKLLFTKDGISIRDEGWALREYKCVEVRNDYDELISYESECLMGYLIMHGSVIQAGLQATTALLDNVEQYNAILPMLPMKNSKTRGLASVSIYDSSFLNHPNREFIEVAAQENIKSLSTMVHLMLGAKKVNGYLPVSEHMIRTLGAYEDGNGIHLGPSKAEAEHILERLIPDLLTRKDWDTQNSVYDLFSVKLRKPRKVYNILGMVFNNDLSRKGWFKSWLGILQGLDADSLGNGKLDRKIREAIFDKEGINRLKDKTTGQDKTFDATEAGFTDDDIELARDIVKIMEQLFRRYIFDGIYSGKIFPKYGALTFMAQPWKIVYDSTNDETRIKLPLIRLMKGANAMMITPDSASAIGHIAYANYHLARSILPIILQLEKDDGSIVELMPLKGVPKEYFFPHFADPKEIAEKVQINEREVAEKQQYFEIRRYILNEFKSHLEPVFDVEGEKSILMSALLKVIIAKYGHIGRSKVGYIEAHCRAKLFSSAGGETFRADLLDWLTSRGRISKRLKYFGRKFMVLKEADFKFFKNDYDKMMFSLRTVSLTGNLEVKKKLTEDRLKKMTDLIFAILGFVKEISELAGNEKIVLYPFLSNIDGYGFQSHGSQHPLYYPTKEALNLKQDNLGALEDWFRHLMSGKYVYNEVGFIFDPNRPQSFVRLIPEFLALLFVAPSAFVVRIPEKDMARDVCFVAFDSIGAIVPGQLKGARSIIGVRPPFEGMKAWNELDYGVLGHKLNEILSKHDLLGLSYFKDPEVFYGIVRKVLHLPEDDAV